MKCKPGSCSVVSSQTELQCFWRRTSATRCRGSRYLYACSCPHFSLQTQMPLRKKCTARLASPRGMLWLSSRTWLWMVRDCANFIMCRCCSHCTLQRPQARAAFKLPHSAVANMHIQHVMCQSRRTEKQQHSRAPPASPIQQGSSFTHQQQASLGDTSAFPVLCTCSRSRMRPGVQAPCRKTCAARACSWA